MKVNYKKAIFVVAGLLAIGAALSFGKSSPVEAALKAGQKFDDWTIACDNASESTNNKKNKQVKQTCYLTQALINKKDEKTQQTIAVYRIGYFNNAKTLKIMQVLPLGVSLQTGTSIISSEKLIAPGKFTTCYADGCLAVADIKKEDIETMLASKQNFIAMMSIEGKQINLPISPKGLKEGIEALSK